MSTAVDALAALAQESRLKVFRLLVKAGPEGRPAGEIAEELGIPRATLSFHLSQLTHAGLIYDRRMGRSIIYAIRVEAIRGLLGFLTEDCCGGRPELCAPLVESIDSPRAKKRGAKARRTSKKEKAPA